MNRDDLRKVAAELNITGRSKMTKDELSDAIFEHPNNPLTVNRHGDVTDPRDTTPLPTTPEREAKRDTMIAGYGGNPDEFPSVESQHRMIDLAVMGNKWERHAARMGKTKTSAVNRLSERRILRMIRASGSRRYGMNGRGLGAKHFASGLDQFTGHTLPFGRVNNPDAIKPLAYGDRVRHYAKQAGQPTASADGFPGPALTARQWRRIDKKDNKLKFGPSHATKERRYV